MKKYSTLRIRTINNTSKLPVYKITTTVRRAYKD